MMTSLISWNRALFFLFLGAGLATSPAATVTLYPVADTTLFQNNPVNNLGAEPTLVCGSTASTFTNRALIKFSLQGVLPPVATVHQATLTLTVTKKGLSQAVVFSAHRMLRDWGEGTGINSSSGGVGSSTGRPALEGEATFLERFHADLLWNQPGAAAPGDYVIDASASQIIDDVGSYEFTSPGLVAEVRSWIADSGTNFGWILICETELTAGSARRLGSREDLAHTPTLAIEYTLPSRAHVTLPSVADTSLFELKTNYNLGATTLVAGTVGEEGGGSRSRALLRFATQDFPSDSVLTRADLTLNVIKVSNAGSQAPSTFDLHRLLQPWGEGNKLDRVGNPADPGEATWAARFFPFILWSSPGAGGSNDFLDVVSSKAFIDNLGSYTFTNLLPDIKFWQTHPGQNFGWILRSEDEVTLYTARRFGSREDPANAPTLELEYVPLPVILVSQIMANEFRFSFIALAGESYAIQSRDSLSLGNWLNFTNFPAAASTQTNLVAAPFTNSQRFYRLGIVL